MDWINRPPVLMAALRRKSVALPRPRAMANSVTFALLDSPQGLFRRSARWCGHYHP